MGKHLDRADILLDLDRYDLAETELRQEIAENPDSDLAHGSLARCLINQRKLGKDTLEIVEYALSLNPENDWLHYLLAVYWHMSCDFNRAQTAIGVAIELDPNSALYFDTLARILFDRGNDKFNTHSTRVQIFVFLISRGGLLPIVWGLLGVFKGFWIRSYLQPVFTPLTKSLSLDPEYLSAINLHTHLLIETNRFDRALTSSLNGLEIDPSDSIAHRLYGQVLLRLGKYTAARDQFQISLSIDPSSSESKANLLEAVRSQYWIYPWISNTNWRGILVLMIGFTICISLGISMIWFNNEGLFAFFTYLIFIPAIFISLAAKSIFNLLLQFSPKDKLLITSSVPIHKIVLGNYLASLTVVIISSTYLLIALVAATTLNNISILAMIGSILGVIGGILISTVTFIPVTDRQRSRSLSHIYQLIVIGLGAVNIAVYLASIHIETLDYLFVGLVFMAPLFAIYSNPN